MMRIALEGVLVMLIVATGRTAAAPPDSSGQRYTIEKVVETALRLNHGLAAARFEVEQSDARVREAWGYALPKLDLLGTYSRALKKQVFFLPDFNDLSSGRVQPVEIGSDHSLNMGVSASQVLFNSAVFTGVGAARVYSRAARDVLRAKEVETVTNARKAFYGVQVAGEVVAMMRETMTNAEENLHNVKVLTAQGLSSEYDQLRAEVGVANLRPEVINAENSYSLALNNLKITMGIPFSDTVEVDGTLEFEPLPPRVMEAAAESVLILNPGLRAARLQTEVNDAFITAERSNYLPTLAAFGNYQWQTQKNDLHISSADFVGSAIVGLTLSMNVFSGLQTNARVEQAKLELRKSEEQVVGLELGLRTLVESITLRLRSAAERVEAQGKTVEMARKGYRIANTRFTSGSGTQLEVRDAILALTAARVNRIQAIYDYLVASAELDQALGRLPAYVEGAIEE